MQWRSWGGRTATADAIYNEAVLTGNNNIPTAPRRRWAVRVVASQIRVCGRHRTYTRVVIKFDRVVNGRKTMVAAVHVPKCSEP